MGSYSDGDGEGARVPTKLRSKRIEKLRRLLSEVAGGCRRLWERPDTLLKIGMSETMISSDM